MHRRDFCKIFGEAATAIITSSSWSRAQAAGVVETESFDYGQFCSIPESERTFSVVSKDRIARERLDRASWKPNTWGAPEKIPGIPDSWDGVPMESPIPGLNGSGPYAGSWNSLLSYEAPEWYQDAKFGIWAHWSPQCVPEKGDWYARNMYVEGSEQYKSHLEHYGHPSNFGYKDLCPQWTLLNWEPEELVDRCKKAGARFIFAHVPTTSRCGPIL